LVSSPIFKRTFQVDSVKGSFPFICFLFLFLESYCPCSFCESDSFFVMINFLFVTSGIIIVNKKSSLRKRGQLPQFINLKLIVYLLHFRTKPHLLIKKNPHSKEWGFFFINESRTLRLMLR
jgi:hypothetical protein